MYIIILINIIWADFMVLSGGVLNRLLPCYKYISWEGKCKSGHMLTRIYYFYYIKRIIVKLTSLRSSQATQKCLMSRGDQVNVTCCLLSGSGRPTLTLVMKGG